MVIFYSGYGCKWSDPEAFFGYVEANVMLTAVDSLGKLKPEQRFRKYVKVRRKGKGRTDDSVLLRRSVV